MKNKKTETLKHIQKIRQLMSKVKSPYAGMSEQRIINEIRKTREKLWEEKLAGHFR